MLLCWLASAAAQTSSPEQLGPPSPVQVTAPTNSPTEPNRPPGAEPPPETAPPGEQTPGDDKSNADQVSMSAQYLRRDERNDTVYAEGKVRFRWWDLDVLAHRLTADFRVNQVHLDGPLHLYREDGTVMDSDSFDLDLNDYRYTTGAFTAQVPPSIIGHGAVEPFNLKGSDSISVRDTYFSGHNVVLTSCPLNDRKYHIQAKTIAIVPHKKMVLRSAKVYLFGVPILAFGKLVLPLRAYRRTEWLPEFGRNDVYGWFAKMRYFYDLADSQFGNVSSTVTEKRGTYLGVEHDYGWGRRDFRGDGRFDFQYGSRDADVTARGSLNQKLGIASTLAVNGSFSQNSGFSTTSKQSNVTATLNNRYSVGSTVLGLNRSQSSSGASSSIYSRYNFRQNINLGQLFNADLNANYSVRENSSTATDEELDTDVKFNGGWTLFDWEVIDQRRFDLEGSKFPADDNRPVTEIAPQVTLRTDANRLDLGLPEVIGLNLETSYGALREFIDVPGQTTRQLLTVMRLNSDLRARLANIDLADNLVFSSTAQYSQSFYARALHSAKYVLAFAPGLEWQPMEHIRFDLGYRWQDSVGYSPLSRYDFAQTLNDLSLSARFFAPDPVRERRGIFALALDGGYDLLLGRYRDLRIAAQLAPWDQFYLSLNTSYALASGFGSAGFRSLRGELSWDGGPRFRADIGFTYEPKTGKFRTVDSLLTIEPLPHFTVQQALTYDGAREKVTFNDILATFDMGCVSLLGTYRQQAKEFRIDLNIAAFPGISSLFGTGKFGQQFSTSQGVQF